jgi:hypothetical protein
VATPEKLPDSSPARGKERLDGEITGYFCIGPRCTLPQTDPDEFRQTLREERRVEASLVSA